MQYNVEAKSEIYLLRDGLWRLGLGSEADLSQTHIGRARFSS